MTATLAETTTQAHLLRDLLQALPARTEELVATLEHRELTLVERRVVLVSPNPDDFLLGLMLCAHGAEVQFVTTRAVRIAPAQWSAVVQQLSPYLVVRKLDLEVFTTPGDEFPNWPGFRLLPLLSNNLNAAPIAPGHIVIALGVLPPDPTTAAQTVEELSRYAIVGGCLELFDNPHAPLPPATIREVEFRVGHLCMGQRAVTRNPWHLSLVRLSDPLLDFPNEEAGNDQMMAHCRTRHEFACNFVRGKDVLEAGCATGIGARTFRANGARSVTALEVLPELLAEARRQTNDAKITFQQADLNKPLPLPSGSFDLVVCTEVLEHIHNHQGALSEYLRVLRPGGKVILSVPDPDFESGWNTANRFVNPYHVHVPSDSEFRDLLKLFAEVKLYRQLDVVGTLIVEDNHKTPAGGYFTEGKDLTRGVRAVRLAVCTKAPVMPEESPTPLSTQLRLYRTFTDYQLDGQLHSHYLQNDLLQLRHRAWSEGNRARTAQARAEAFDPAMVHPQARSALLQQTLRTWRASGGALVCRQPVREIQWLARTAHTAASGANGCKARGITPAAPLWMVEPDAEAPLGFELTPAGGVQPPVHSVLFPVAEVHVRYSTLAHWRALGAKEFWFHEPDGWHVVDVAVAWSRRLYQRTLGRVARRCSAWLNAFGERKATGLAVRLAGRNDDPELRTDPDGHLTTHLWDHFLAEDNEAIRRGTPLPVGRPLKVLQYGAALYSGGAERQLCNLLIGQQQRGFATRLRTTYPCTGDQGHYQHLLNDQRVDSGLARAGYFEIAPRQRVNRDLLARVPRPQREPVLALCAEIFRHQPDVLHCWLDEPNLLGGIAGLLAGVPRILLSVRNSNPTNFPRFYQPWMEEWYRRLGKSRRVHLLSNSRSGARSYAMWMEVPEERFHLINNGIDFSHFPEPIAEARRKARQAFGLSERERVVCGVFRLDKEKQPEVFLKVIQATAQRVPNLQVLWAGGGSMHDEVAAQIRDLGLSERVRLLGACKDVGPVFLASDAMLLTSEFEGCPNAAIEAQYLGVPVIATRGGGTPDAIVEGQTGYLAAVGDVETLTERLVQVLSDEPLRQRLSEQGRTFAAQEFGIDQMVDLHTLTYCRLFEPVETPRRVVTPLLSHLEAEQRAAGSAFAERTSRPGERAQTAAPEAPELGDLLRRLGSGPVLVSGSDVTAATLAVLQADGARPVWVVGVWPGTNEAEEYLACLGAGQPWRTRLKVVARPGSGVTWTGPALAGVVFTPGAEVEADLPGLVPHLRPEARVAVHGYDPSSERSKYLDELLESGAWQWETYRATLLTLRRATQPREQVVAHNQARRAAVLQGQTRHHGAA